MDAFIALADVHLSGRKVAGRDRLPAGQKVLDDTRRLALYRGIEWIFVIGDLVHGWHYKSGVDPQVLLAVHSWLRSCKLDGLKVVWIAGNHEYDARSGNLMYLFQDLCIPITSPRPIRITRSLHAYALPWFQSHDLIKNAAALSVMALKEEGTRVLLAHAGVREGKVLPSNKTGLGKIGLAHLYPDAYDLILLGDYHAHQWLRSNCMYLWAPMPHTFGDPETSVKGIWVVSMDADGLTIEDVPVKAPAFRQWFIRDRKEIEATPPLPGYDPEDYNRIYVTPELLSTANLLFLGSGADILVLTEEGESYESYEKREDAVSDEELIDRWLELRKVRPESRPLFKKIGLDCLSKAST